MQCEKVVSYVIWRRKTKEAKQMVGLLEVSLSMGERVVKTRMRSLNCKACQSLMYCEPFPGTQCVKGCNLFKVLAAICWFLFRQSCCAYFSTLPNDFFLQPRMGSCLKLGAAAQTCQPPNPQSSDSEKPPVVESLRTSTSTATRNRTKQEPTTMPANNHPTNRR